VGLLVRAQLGEFEKARKHQCLRGFLCINVMPWRILWTFPYFRNIISDYWCSGKLL